MDDTTFTSTTSDTLPLPGVDILTPLLRVLFGGDGMLGGVSLAGTLGVLEVIWTVFVVLSYLASALFLVLYIYAALHKAELEEQQDAMITAGEKAFAGERQGGATQTRFADMQAHVNSDNPNDWKLAIIEADIILDEALKRHGYAGTSLGERLRSVSPQALQTLDDAWEAHKVRNEIAHSGVDFLLTQKLARDTILRYERVFAELGLL